MGRKKADYALVAVSARELSPGDVLFGRECRTCREVVLVDGDRVVLRGRGLSLSALDAAALERHWLKAEPRTGARTA